MFPEYLFQTLDSIQYPGEIAVNSGVNPRHPFSSTQARTEADDSNEMRSVEGRAPSDDVSHEATPTVPHTGVPPGLSTSADLRPSQHSATLGVNIPGGEETGESSMGVYSSKKSLFCLGPGLK